MARNTASAMPGEISGWLLPSASHFTPTATAAWRLPRANAQGMARDAVNGARPGIDFALRQSRRSGSSSCCSSSMPGSGRRERRATTRGIRAGCRRRGRGRWAAREHLPDRAGGLQHGCLRARVGPSGALGRFLRHHGSSGRSPTPGGLPPGWRAAHGAMAGSPRCCPMAR